MKRIFGILGKVAQVAAPIFGGPFGAIGASVLGSLMNTHTASNGIPGILSGVTFGLQGNFVGGFASGFVSSFYLSNSAFRSGINEAIGAAFEAVKGVIF